MSDIYVFSSDEESNDYSTMGLCGALDCTSCTFSETVNGESIVELEHPLDDFGKYSNLDRGNILVVPVPVRTTPEIQNGSCVTTVWTYKVKPLAQLTSKNQRTLYKKSSGSGKMKVMNAGDTMTVVQIPDDDDIKRYKVKTKYGTGWVDPNGIQLVTEHKISDNSQAIEEIQSPWSVQPQYFRIYETQKTLDSVKVSARHISYDLLYDVTYYDNGGNSTALGTVIDNILSKTYGGQTQFKGYTNVTNTKAGLSFRGKNPIDCFLDPDEGVCAQYDVGLVRDNYDLYFLHDPGLNRGVRIQYGKNMTGVDFTSSDDEVATRIVPVGETKDGDPLYLSDTITSRYIDSDKIGDYPVKHVHYYECENCKVGDKDDEGGTVTTAVARARMKQQAQDLIDDGCDEPSIEMSVEFLNLGDTEEYKQFKNLENCFLFDYILVQHPKLGIDVTAQITKIEWDCLLDRMNSVEIGEVGETLANTGITSWQIPSGFSGSKIGNGTIGNGALQSDIISTKHLQSDSVSTTNLQANSVTTEKIFTQAITTDKLDTASVTTEKLAAGSVTADKISAGSITADKLDAETVDARVADILQANLTTANIEKADIDWASISTLVADISSITKAQISEAEITSAQITDLQAKVADIIHLTAQYGEFSLAEIKNLLSNALILEQGVADSMMITNLSVTNANLLNATIGDLVLKSTSGGYFAVRIDSNGDIFTEKVTVTDQEISAGETSDGKQIVATNANVESLNASTVKASQAILSTIFTDSLTAGKITAGELLSASASINSLYVDAIEAIGNSLTFSANEKIQSIVGSLDETTQMAQDASDTASNTLAKADELEDSLATVDAAAKAAQASANTNAANLTALQTTVTQTINGLSIVQTKQTSLEGRVETIESGVHIEGSEIGIYSSDSPFQNRITNTGWSITENDAAIITCAETKLTAPRIQVTDALMLSGLAIRPGSDKHTRILKYGK